MEAGCKSAFQVISQREREGAHSMGIALRMSKTQILILVLVLVSLIIATLIVLHAATPNLFHAIAYTPKILNRH